MYVIIIDFFFHMHVISSIDYIYYIHVFFYMSEISID